MKRFISALALCVSLLVLLVLFLFPPSLVSAAKENVLIKLLNLPAPPPPNPLVKGSRARDEKFYDKNNPPLDNAPIEDLIDYWTHQSENYQGTLYYSVRPSERTLDRLAGEMSKNPELASRMLNILPDSQASIDIIKELYERPVSEDGVDKDQRKQFRDWLRLHSPYFSGDLARASQQIKDFEDYVDMKREEDFLALTRYDFDKASPIINQFYNDNSQPVSKALATWALYRRALDTNSLGDIERYRIELMRMVEDRSLSDGTRDMANDALTREPDFPGRDEWTISLFEDETLVNMQRFSMLTTLIMYSSPDKYVPKMISLIEKTSNPTVRAAAVHNLAIILSRNPSTEMEKQIVQSLLPWLEDPKWASDSGWLRDTRGNIVTKLSEHRIPESVPGLIRMLDEKEKQTKPSYDFDFDEKNANVAVNAMRAAGAAMNAARLANTTKKDGPTVFSYPYRQSAMAALAKQKDGRAVPALRRVLYEVNGYERSIAVKALLECSGFTLPEQIAALEAAAKRENEQKPFVIDGEEVNAVLSSKLSSNIPRFTAVTNVVASPRPITEPEIKDLLGQQLMQAEEISDELARAIVDRIEVLDEKDPRLAATYRTMILRWQNAVISMLLLRDVKRDIADVDTVVRLLSQRKNLREQLPNDVSDLRNGKPSATGISACIFENEADYAAILETGDAVTKTAMLACSRLIRSPLPVAVVAENLKSTDQLLQTAAERYLESEDSPEARAFVLARHPNEAMILGATSAFYVKGASEETSNYLWQLYQSLGNDALYNGWGASYNDDQLEAVEKRLQDEVKKDDNLVGVYSYDSNYIRIYKDRVMFSWEEDDSRYRERPLAKEEFDEIKDYFIQSKVDELTPFLSCGGDYCSAKELVMLGRNGGRRVYTSIGGYGPGAKPSSEFFTWLDKYFANLKLTRASLKYNLSRDIPGLEILLASDDLHAETVWASGADVRVAASDVAVRKKVDAEIENLFSNDEESDEGYNPEKEAKRAAMAEKRLYEGYAWYKVADGVATASTQPPQAEYIPRRDALAVQPDEDHWKTRAGEMEIRASSEGLYKVVGGRLTRIHKGNYRNPVITPNGRWAAVSKSGEMGISVVRVDLVTNREYPVEIEGYGQRFPAAYVPTLNKFLIVNNDRYYEYEGGYSTDQDDIDPDDANPAGMLLLDPATGVMQPIAGEFRPLSQQTFRPLQQTSKPNEFWAAMHDPEKNETLVGVYDTKVFGFKQILRIPKINFNSMSMWVDEAIGKVYFVYRGHLLALPLRAALTASNLPNQRQ